jgi:hypothetical protein
VPIPIAIDSFLRGFPTLGPRLNFSPKHASSDPIMQLTDIWSISYTVLPDEMNRMYTAVQDSTTRVGNIRLASLDTVDLLEKDSVSTPVLPIGSISHICGEGNGVGVVNGLLVGGSIWAGYNLITQCSMKVTSQRQSGSQTILAVGLIL